MDVRRLSEVLGWMRSDESRLKIQVKLTNLQAALQNLSSSPGDQNFQVQLTSSLDELSNTLENVTNKYDPSETDRIKEIGGGPFFTRAMSDRILAQIAANPMSPATALEEINKIVEERQKFISRVKSTELGIDEFVEYGLSVEQGEAAVGFEIPRDLFDNEFRDFIAELRAILRIVRVYAEVELGSTPEIKLGTISSTDPLIFLHTPPVVVASIAAAVSWILSNWKKLEEIRKLRAETAKLKDFDKSEIEEFFDSKISSTLDRAISDKVTELMAKSKLDDSRKAELDSELGWALKALFARIERGMRVEVAVHLLKSDDENPLTEDQQKQQEILAKIDQLAGELSFPRVEAEPILSLPKINEVEASPAISTKGSTSG